MGYEKTTWNEGIAPGMSAALLNHLETQFEEVEKLFNAHTILIAVSDDTPVPLIVPASSIVGRKSTGNIVALTGAELMAILTGKAGAPFSMNSKRLTTLGVPTTVGDALRKGTRITVLELPALADEKMWKGTGGNVEEVDMPGPFLIVSDTLQNSNDTERSTILTSYVKLKEIQINQKVSTGSNIRIKFDIKVLNGSTVYGKLYRNGVPFGTEQLTSSGTYQTFSQDFNAGSWVIGDLIQLYIKSLHGGETYRAYCRNLRFYYDILLSTTNQDP